MQLHDILTDEVERLFAVHGLVAHVVHVKMQLTLQEYHDGVDVEKVIVDDQDLALLHYILCVEGASAFAVHRQWLFI